MKIRPTLTEVRKIASELKYNVLPVSCEILSDFTTPIETMRILKNISTHCYMLESAQANETWGRYTFLGFDSKLEITCMEGKMQIGNFKVTTEDPSAYCVRSSPITKVLVLGIFPLLRAGLSDIFHMITSGTASLL